MSELLRILAAPVIGHRRDVVRVQGGENLAGEIERCFRRHGDHFASTAQQFTFSQHKSTSRTHFSHRDQEHWPAVTHLRPPLLRACVAARSSILNATLLTASTSAIAEFARSAATSREALA